MKRVAVITFSNFRIDQRILREVAAIVKLGYHVTVYDQFNPESTFSELNFEGTTVKIKSVMKDTLIGPKNSTDRKNFVSKLPLDEIDVIHCHNFQTLYAIGNGLKKIKDKNIKVIYDCHEYFAGYPPYPIINNYSASYRKKLELIHKYYRLLEKRFIKHVDHVITVGYEIAKLLERDNKLKNKVVVVRNIPDTQTDDWEEDYNLRSEFSVDKDEFLLIYVGKYKSGWDYSQDLAFQCLSKIENVSLILMGRDFQEYSKEIYQVAKKYNIETKIHIKPPISKSQVPVAINKADAFFLPLWQPNVTNIWLCNPNKLFDGVISGVPMFSTCQPEFKHLIDENENGVYYNPEIDNDFNRSLEKLRSNYTFFKERAEVIQSKFSWQSEVAKMINIYQGN